MINKKVIQNKGITLIALVITIIILLILAGVTISMVFNGGIISKSKTAVDTYQMQEDKEQIELAKAEVSFNNLGKIPVEELKETLIKYNFTICDEITEFEGKQLTEEEFVVKCSHKKHTYLVMAEELDSEEQAKVKELYVYLYENGELVFTSDISLIDESKVKINYGNIKGKNNIYDTSSLTTNVVWFENRKDIITVNFLDEIEPIDTAFWFFECENLIAINNINKLNTKYTTDMTGMFWGCGKLTTLNLSSFNTSKVTNMLHMFDACSALTSIDISNFDTRNVTNMSGMFAVCSGLTNIDLSKFDTTNVTNMSAMFYGCGKLTTLNLNSFNTSKVTDMSHMFDSCSALTSIDLSNFDTTNVVDMSVMFWGCGQLTTLNLSSFNTSKVTNMSYMFNACSALTSIDVSNFDTTNVINMYGMFANCSGLINIDLSKFDTINVTDMSAMFFGCTNLAKVYIGEKWTTDKAVTDNMFMGCNATLERI